MSEQQQENSYKLVKLESQLGQILDKIERISSYIARIENIEKKQHAHEHESKSIINALGRLKKENTELKKDLSNFYSANDKRVTDLENTVLRWETLAKPTIGMFKKIGLTIVGLMAAGVGGFLFALFEMYVKTK